jgi:ribose/xylose/arabinose/galactoside ABC-type transport system permease subunit
MSDVMENILKAPAKSASPTWKPSITWAAVMWRGMIVWLLIALIILCRILYPGFLARDNIFNILSQNVQVGLIALGMTFVMIAGGFDLSVGAIYAAGATVYAMEAKVMALPLAALLALAVGLIAGTVNGLIVTRLRVDPFVATLGTTSIFGGAAYLYSHSAPVLVDRPDFTVLEGRKVVQRADLFSAAYRGLRHRGGGAVEHNLWPFALCRRRQSRGGAVGGIACRPS